MSRHQLKRWAVALSAGINQGLGGPALGLNIQAYLPASAPGVPPASLREGVTRAGGGGASRTGVQA